VVAQLEDREEADEHPPGCARAAVGVNARAPAHNLAKLGAVLDPLGNG
jgi:hypothetical protein